MIQFGYYVSDGLKPPTRSTFFWWNSGRLKVSHGLWLRIDWYPPNMMVDWNGKYGPDSVPDLVTKIKNHGCTPWQICPRQMVVVSCMILTQKDQNSVLALISKPKLLSKIPFTEWEVESIQLFLFIVNMKWYCVHICIYTFILIIYVICVSQVASQVDCKDMMIHIYIYSMHTSISMN